MVNSYMVRGLHHLRPSRIVDKVDGTVVRKVEMDDKRKTFLEKLEMAFIRAGRSDVFKIATNEYRRSLRKVERMGFDVSMPDDEFCKKEWKPRVPRKSRKVEHA